MNEVNTPFSEGELLSIIKPLIIKLLEEEFLSKISNSTLTNSHANGNGIAFNSSVPVNLLPSADSNRSKELELIERVIRVEEQGNYIREDIKKVHIDMKELRQDMKELRQDMKDEFIAIRQEMKDEFIAIRQEMKELRQDMKDEFIAVRQEMKELRQDIDKRFNRQEKVMFLMFGFITTILSTLITVLRFIK